MRIWLAAIMTAAVSFTGCGPTVEPESSAVTVDETESEAAIDAAPEFRVKPLEGRSLIVVLIDGWPATRAHAYGYATDSTPFISQLAAESLVVETAHAASSFLGQSLSALLTGRYPTAGGTIGLIEAHPLDETATLPQQFLRAGYYTGIVTNQPRVRGRGFTKGFEDVQIGPADARWSSDQVVRRAMNFLEDAGSDPYYLQVQFADLQVWQTKHAGAVDAVPAALTAEFDAALAELDTRVATLIEAVRSTEQGREAAIVVTSPHGAELGEHEFVGHGWTLYEEAVRVPLILHAPGAVPAGRFPHPVSLASLAPTLAALFGLDALPEPLDAPAWAHPVEEGFALVRPGGTRIAEVVIPERCVVRAVWDGDWKYIATIATHPPSERVRVESEYLNIAVAMGKGETSTPDILGLPMQEELYNLATDPRERTNLADVEFDLLARMRGLLTEYANHCREQGLSARQITQREIPEGVNLEQLESLGYL